MTAETKGDKETAGGHAPSNQVKRRRVVIARAGAGVATNVRVVEGGNELELKVETEVEVGIEVGIEGSATLGGERHSAARVRGGRRHV